MLETGAPPARLAETYGRYPAMFARLLGDGFQAPTFRVNKGELPAPDAAIDAYLVTGSPAGVYDDLPWIEPLAEFLRSVRGKKKLVGVCFGHQMLAQAFGGKVIKSPKGWGVGLQRYAITEREPWMDSSPAVFLTASHQDQVVELPPGARVIAASEFTPHAGLAYGDEAISFQPHPEFEPDFSAALFQERSEALPPDLARQAVESLSAPNDNARLGRWIGKFLRS